MDDGAAEQEQWQQTRLALEAATADPVLRRDAHRALWEICQVLHDPDAALKHLHSALADDPLFTRPRRASPQPPQRSVLLLAAPGDFQANLPLDRLFDDSTDLHTLWITDPLAVLEDPQAAIPADLPPIDCVFIAIAEDARHGPVLQAADALAAAIGRPVINRGGHIARLSRAGTACLLSALPHALVPSHHLLAHADPSPIAFPIIIRPLGSHAGQGLQKLEHEAELASYYAGKPQVRQFTVAPFVDYRSKDGCWRKYRVIFVDGVPYPLHLAIHDDWAVWYYNAAMAGCEARLAEENEFLRDLAACFPEKAILALREIAARVDLDYFGLDCGIMPDGRLLVFELETGMIVHQRRPEAGEIRDPGAAIRRAVERMIADRSISKGVPGSLPARAVARRMSARACCATDA